jgi:iron(III) transport system substrate-binding protein
MNRRSLLALSAATSLSAALPRGAAAQGGQVVAYTAFAESVTAMTPPFKARTGQDVQLVAAGSGELVRRIVAEKARPLADAIISVGGESIDANPAVFAKYAPKEDAAILPVLKVSPNWIPFSVTLATVLAVNTKLVPEAEIPTTWEQLADPKWKGRIAYAGADRSGSALIQLLQILHNFGMDKGWALFERMVENFVITGSSGAVSRGAAQGEYAIGITLEDNAQRFIDGGAPLKVVYPKEGISFAADAMALVAGGPNPDGGKALIDFIVSAEGQRIIVEKFGRRPIRADVAQPKGALSVTDLPVNNAPIEWTNANTKAVMARYLRLVRR